MAGIARFGDVDNLSVMKFGDTKAIVRWSRGPSSTDPLIDGILADRGVVRVLPDGN